jgi:hypothetical protein
MTSESHLDQPSAKAQSAAERMRAYRRRRRYGHRYVKVQFGPVELDGLIANGYFRHR